LTIKSVTDIYLSSIKS